MTTRKLRSESGGSGTGDRTSKVSRQQQQGRHSARSMQSTELQNVDDLSITGSTIDVSRGSSLRELQGSSEGFMTKVSKKPASPRPKIAAAFKTSQSQKVSEPRPRSSSAKHRPKPAWLAGSHETPRSEVSELIPSKPIKPSLADFLDDSESDRSRGVGDARVEGVGKASVLSKVSEEGRSGPLPEMFLQQHTSLQVDNFQQLKARQDKVTEIKKQQIMELDAVGLPQEINGAPGEPGRTSTAPLHPKLGKSKPKFSGTEEERTESAAKVIQLWYRRFRNRRKAGEAALRRLMDGKRQEMESRLSQEKALMSQDHAKLEGELAKKKRREEKARQARLAAIEELRSKREGIGSDKGGTKKKLTFLQPSGKVTKEKSKHPEAKRKDRTEGNDPLTFSSFGGDFENRPTTASSVGRKVDAIFEESLSRSSKVGADADQGDGSETAVEESVATIKGSKTTYEDLMSTLNELESNPVEPTNIIGIRNQGYEERRNINIQASGVNYSVTTDQDGACERTQEPLLTADKLKTIMNFLDEVEKAEEDIRSEVTRQSRDVTARSSFPTWEDGAIDLDKEITPSDSASQVVTDIDNAITAQKQELSRKNESLNMLQKALQQQKEFSSLHVQEVEKEYREQISIQRKEYEATIQRHLSFIDQLIDDKKALSSRCETLVKKLKETDEKYSAKIKKMEEDHAVEFKKQKDMMEAAEKLRREKWVQEKTKQIKEVTVKGLEPDIQRLIAKHKADIKKLKAAHQGELLEADERAGRKYIRQIEETRERLEAEKDAAVQKERDIAKQRFEKQLEQEEENYQQQRRRLYAEVQEEKERVSQQIHAVREELREEKDASQSSSRQSIMRMQEEHQKAIEEMERRHISELNNMKEQLDIEKQQWIENHMKKQEVYLASKERELKEGVREARDKEIEMVIARLEEETARAQEENTKASENRIKRIIEKYENEMKELERSEKIIQDKYNKLKVQIQEQEGEDLRLKSQVKQKEQEVVDMKRLTDQLQQERGKVSDIIRQEFADRLVMLEEDNKRLRTEMSEMRARHRLELDRISNEKDMEMEEVHKRVKQAVSKKEETSSLLRQQLRAAEKRAEQLEMLLAEQRKKLLS